MSTAAELVSIQIHADPPPPGLPEGGVRQTRPDPLVIGQQPGYCGSCARWEVHSAPMEHMGLCSAGRAAHGWLDGYATAPVETQAGLSCQAHSGKAWRAL